MPASNPSTLTDMLDTMPFARALGIVLEEATPRLTRASLRWRPEHCTLGGALHGGVLMALADSVGIICAYLNVPPGGGTATVESKSNFFRAIRAGTLHAAARPLHIGRSFVVVQTDLTDDQGRPVGQTTQTQAVVGA